MKALPNGITVFNATPHPITFWKEGWEAPVVVKTDVVINATVVEWQVGFPGKWLNEAAGNDHDVVPVAFVKTKFEGNEEGRAVATNAAMAGCIVVGSIIAAQAYGGLVVAMTPAPGYERVAPAEKRMNPDKFTVF